MTKNENLELVSRTAAVLCGASKKAEGVRVKWKSQAGGVESAGAYQQQKFSPTTVSGTP